MGDKNEVGELKQRPRRRRIGMNNIARGLALIVGLVAASAASGHTRTSKLCDLAFGGPDDAIRDASNWIEFASRQCATGITPSCRSSLALNLGNRAEAYCAKGQTAQALADANKSVNFWQEVPREDNDSASRAGIYSTRADLYVKLGKLDLAIADYTKSLEIEDNWLTQWSLSDAYFEQAELFLNKRNYRGAIGAYDGIIRILNPAPGGDSRGPHDDARFMAWLVEAYAGKSYAHEMLGQFDNAAAAYTALMALDDKDADARFARGRVRMAQGDRQHALEDFTAAVDDFPNEPEYRLARGKTYLALGNADAALADFDAAIARAPSAESYLLRAQSRRGKGDLAGALADLNEAIKRDNASAPAYINRAFVKAAMHDLDDAVTDCDAAIRLDSKSPAYFTMRGVIWGTQGNLDKAIADYGSAIALDPQDAQTYTMRAWALFKAGKMQDALNDANRALALKPSLADALVTRGHIYEAMGKSNEAIADFKRLLAIAPETADARAALKRLGAVQ